MLVVVVAFTLTSADASALTARERRVLVAALIEHESHGDPRAVNARSGALGLGQILPSTRRSCQNLESAECAAERERLLDPHYNRSLVESYLKQMERTCKAKTARRPSMAGLVMGYGGWNRTAATVRKLRAAGHRSAAERHSAVERWCNLERRRGRWVEARVPKAVRDVMRLYRKHLRRMDRKHLRGASSSSPSSRSRSRTSTSSSSARRSGGSKRRAPR